MNIFRDNGGKLPPRPQWKEWVKEHHEILRKINRNPRYLKPIVKVRREVLSNSYGTLTRWKWECGICGLGRAQSGWWIAMDTADRHARNHHRSGK